MGKKSKYPTPKRIKVGRNLYVCDYDGKPLVGLSWDSGNGQYFYSHYRNENDYQTGKTTRKDYSFGVHYQDAVFKYKQWIRDNRTISLTLPTAETDIYFTVPNPSDEENEKFIFSADEIDTDWLSPSNIESIIKTNKQYALQMVKQLLMDEEIRIETVRYLKLDDLLPKQFKPLPFKKVVQFYEDTNPCSKKEKRKVKTTVEHFISIVKKKNINDITEDDLELFKDIILKSKYSDTYKTGRLSRVKTALSYYLENKKKNAEKELVRSFLTLCREILKTSAAKPDDKPKSIDNKTLKEIFHQAKQDDELLLILLLMLNTGFTPVDIRTLKKTMIRTMDEITYIVHRRTKTDEQYIRVNCLWDITARLLKMQCDRYPYSEYAFITKAGGNYTESSMDKRLSPFFRALNEKNNTSYSAKHFKDTVASNLAFDVTNVNVIKVTLGHSIKNAKDEFWKYVEDRPEQQKPAIDILYKKFKDAINSIKNT